MIAYKMALEGSWIPVWTQVNPVANNLLKGRVPISEKSGMNCVNIAIMGEEVQCQWIQQCCRDRGKQLCILNLELPEQI